MPVPSLSGLFSCHGEIPRPQRKFTMRYSGLGGTTIVLSEVDWANVERPLYTATASKDTKTQVQLAKLGNQGGQLQAGQGQPIGASELHDLSDEIDMLLHGQVLKMKKSLVSMNGGYEVKGPQIPGMIWRKTHLAHDIFELFDQNEQILARYKRVGGSPLITSSWSFEIFVPLSEAFLDVVVLSGLTLQQKERRDE